MQGLASSDDEKDIHQPFIDYNVSMPATLFTSEEDEISFDISKSLFENTTTDIRSGNINTNSSNLISLDNFSLKLIPYSPVSKSMIVSIYLYIMISTSSYYIILPSLFFLVMPSLYRETTELRKASIKFGLTLICYLIGYFLGMTIFGQLYKFRREYLKKIILLCLLIQTAAYTLLGTQIKDDILMNNQLSLYLLRGAVGLGSGAVIVGTDYLLYDSYFKEKLLVNNQSNLEYVAFNFKRLENYDSVELNKKYIRASFVVPLIFIMLGLVASLVSTLLPIKSNFGFLIFNAYSFTNWLYAFLSFTTLIICIVSHFPKHIPKVIGNLNERRDSMYPLLSENFTQKQQKKKWEIIHFVTRVLTMLASVVPYCMLELLMIPLVYTYFNFFQGDAYTCPYIDFFFSLEKNNSDVVCLISFNTLCFIAFFLVVCLVFVFVSSCFSPFLSQIFFSFFLIFDLFVAFVFFFSFQTLLYYGVAAAVFIGLSSFWLPLLKFIESLQLISTTQAQFLERTINISTSMYEEGFRVILKTAFIFLWIYFYKFESTFIIYPFTILSTIVLLFLIFNFISYFDRNKLLTFKNFRPNTVAEEMLREEIEQLKSKISELQQTLSQQTNNSNIKEYQSFLKKEREKLKATAKNEFPSPYESEQILRENVTTLRRHLVYLHQLQEFK